MRVTDNTSLNAAVASAEAVVPVYILSTWKNAHRWTGPNRQHFLCESLASLDESLRGVGGSLVVRSGDAVDELMHLVAESGAVEIHFNRDPDPHGRAVEARLEEACRLAGIAVVPHKDVAIHERDEVLTGAGETFRVFTPYSKAWAKLPKPAVGVRVKELVVPVGISSLPLPDVSHWELKPASAGVLEGGEKAARARMASFLNSGIARYGVLRDMPSVPATSRLSQDLRYGLLSIRELHEACMKKAEELDAEGRVSAMKYVAELIWREFYMQILWNYPEVLEREFNLKYHGMIWPGNPEAFERWKFGQTGFPIVDAAMRELLETGFMHNRTRMITAMFLTKDLHLDWRLGESWFMQQLVDGEIASNNGGWQWSAGTGADAAPYFRIQNPWSQTKRYAADGVYIKKWIPELREVDPSKFLEPPAPGMRLAANYPTPMVDHAAARDVTLDMFKIALSERGS